MMETKVNKSFICLRCGYETCMKSNLMNHLKRKNVCKPSSQNVDIAPGELMSQLQKKGDFRCHSCSKSYINEASFKRHQIHCNTQHNTTSLNELQSMKGLIQELKQEIAALRSNHITSHTTHNTTNTINLSFNNFGNESIDHLTPSFLTECILSLNGGLKNLIHKIHFDPDVPANKNIRVKSLKNNLLEHFTDGQWIPCDKNNTLDIMINKGYRILYRHFLNSLDTDDHAFKDREEYIQDYFVKIAGKDNNMYFELRRDLFIMVMNNELLVLGA